MYPQNIAKINSFLDKSPGVKLIFKPLIKAKDKSSFIAESLDHAQEIIRKEMQANSDSN